MKGRVLIIAGSDPSGGAGVQADIKTVTALGGYAAAAITALTVQNTKGVSAAHPVSPDVIRAQIEAVMSDIGADAVKIGMIGGVDAARAILDALAPGGGARECPPIVLDPVLAASSGDRLAGAGLVDFLRARLLARAHLATPNIPEAEELTGVKITDASAQKVAGRKLMAFGAKTVLVKGGHLDGEDIVDILCAPAGEKEFRNPRIDAASTHGTGCTLASAAATGLAQGLSTEAAIARAIAYTRQAIKTAPGFGAGPGPLNHAHTAQAPVVKDT